MQIFALPPAAPRCGITRSSHRASVASSKPFSVGRAAFRRRHSSMGTRTAASAPRLVTICGPSRSQAVSNSENLALASCTGHDFMVGFLTSLMTSHYAPGGREGKSVVGWAEKMSPSTLFTISNAPSRHMDLFSAMNFARSWGAYPRKPRPRRAQPTRVEKMTAEGPFQNLPPPFAPGPCLADARGGFQTREPYSPARKSVGSTGVEPLRSSKCSWGEDTLPV